MLRVCRRTRLRRKQGQGKRRYKIHTLYIILHGLWEYLDDNPLTNVIDNLKWGGVFSYFLMYFLYFLSVFVEIKRLRLRSCRVSVSES